MPTMWDVEYVRMLVVAGCTALALGLVPAGAAAAPADPLAGADPLASFGAPVLPPASNPPPIVDTKRLATPDTGARILAPTVARRSPSTSAPRVAAVDEYTPIIGQGLRLPVIGRKRVDGELWIRVLLPRRPNGSNGWVPRSKVRLSEMEHKVFVRRGARRVEVYKGGRVIRRYRVVVGKASTPTPTGMFFAVESLRLHDSWARGKWAIATSAFSNVLFNYAGGQGQVAMHARGSLAGALGSASSHGCIRFDDGQIAKLVKLIANGTPIIITR